MTQVNLKRGETYTLVATAENIVDSKTAEISLSWGCDGEANHDEEVMRQRITIALS